MHAASVVAARREAAIPDLGSRPRPLDPRGTPSPAEQASLVVQAVLDALGPRHLRAQRVILRQWVAHALRIDDAEALSLAMCAAARLALKPSDLALGHAGTVPRSSGRSCTVRRETPVGPPPAAITRWAPWLAEGSRCLVRRCCDGEVRWAVNVGLAATLQGVPVVVDGLRALHTAEGSFAPLSCPLVGPLLADDHARYVVARVVAQAWAEAFMPGAQGGAPWVGPLAAVSCAVPERLATPSGELYELHALVVVDGGSELDTWQCLALTPVMPAEAVAASQADLLAELLGQSLPASCGEAHGGSSSTLADNVLWDLLEPSAGGIWTQGAAAREGAMTERGS